MGEVVVVSSEEDMEMDVVMETGEGKLLPRMVLRVLLVESDDSTRQIIAALLRKCSYRVAAVSDGLKAWEILKRGPQNIDLILTEVELPLISGFALLTLVMEHDICKKIPVIMMSSHDSIGVVFKCMLKGAADFLIKPIRKNELKNLWQHVWRRHSNFVAAQHKVEAASENNAASNQSCDFVASAQKNKECSEKGSDTQSSCTTPCLEAESAYVRNMQGRLQLKSKDASNSCDTDKMKQEECTQSDEETFMPDCESEGKSIKVESEGTLCKRKFKSNAFRNEEDGPAAKMMRWDEGVRSESHREKATITSENRSPNDELVGPSRAAIDLISTFDNCPPKGASGQSTLGDGTNNLSFAPHLELSLRRYSPTDSKTQETVEGHNLNHSNSSAFSWYNGSKTLQSLFPASSGDCAESKKGTSDSYKEFSNEILENTVTNYQWRDAASNNSRENMTTLFIGPSGQVEGPYPSLQPGLIPAPGVSFDSLGAGYDHGFPPFYLQTGAPSVWIPKPDGQQEQSPVQMSSSHCSEIQNLEQGSPTDQMEDERDKNLESEDLRNSSLVTGPSNSSSLCSGVVDHINNIEPGKTWNRNDCTVSASVTKTTDSEGVNDEGHLNHDGFNGMDSHRSIQREAALTKFRLKRKGRCFEKKVRYQSRKRLAEQRPRVKGQFVRQAQCETP